MQKTLRLLIKLQEMERKGQVLIEQKARAPRQIAALQAGVSEAEAHLEERLQMLESVRKLRRQLEGDVEELEGRQARSKQKLLDVKSNKEYQAILKEIDDIQELVGGREDQIIEHMEKAEHLKREIEEQKRRVEEARGKMEREGTELERDAEKADVLIADLKKQQEQLNPQIPADLLKKYQFLKANRAGVALAPVNEGTCQVCHMNLPPQTFIDLQKNEKMLHCPSCQRIIYWVGHEAYQSSTWISGEQE
ncbi:MAG: hypothetical protein JSU72_12120 [Deltaproteobacteria bacterium]|nr:MAG: hypothetical protein JSU72_12120 [Deltaproteobacteria bacterium]